MGYRRTKIVCTMGPASSSPETLKALIEAGMNVARINFSHASQEDHARTIAALRTVSQQLGARVAILQDLAGPKFRIGPLAEGAVDLIPNTRFVLTTRSVPGDQREVSMNCPELLGAVKVGDTLLLADGEFELRVVRTTGTDIICEVIVGGRLRSNKGISAPGASIPTPVPTEKDIADLAFGLQQGVDYVAQSFVRGAEEVRTLKSLIAQRRADVPVIAKLEKRQALDDLDAILAEADAVMIARGDLALEIGIQNIPFIQKEITRKAGQAGKPDITATQMLESMIANPRPTRAEVTDIANAIFDGTDAVMLSGETAIGQYPVQACRMMAQVAEAAEEQINYIEQFKRRPVASGETIQNAIAHAACHTALGIDAKLIICCTETGQTARDIAKCSIS